MITIDKCPVPHLQDEREFNDFLEIYIKLKPEVVFEIGSFYGATLWAWMVNSDSLKRLTSLDLPITAEDGRYDEMVKSRTFWDYWAKAKGIELNQIVADSHNLDTIIKAHKLHEETDVDMLFIDGDHSYQGVKQDWEGYRNLVKPGGITVFHDSTGYDSVKQLCDEIRATGKYKTEEIYHPGGWGLFIVYM